MPIVISHVGSGCDNTKLNHKLYCEMYSYDHEIVSDVRDTPEILEGLSRYAVIRSRLRKLPEGDWLLYLDGNAAIYRPVSIDEMLGTDDRLLVALLGSDPPEPARGLMVWRNTAENREILLRLDIAKGHEFARASIGGDEVDLLRGAGLVPVHGSRNGTIMATRGRVLNWERLNSFAVCFDRLQKDKYSHQYSEDKPYRDFSVSRINRSIEGGGDVFCKSVEYQNDPENYSEFNTDSSVALISLYTPNIRSYAQISESNCTRYCTRHGYAYYVYRDLPDEAPANVSGNWLKAWLLLRHIKDHEWVVWIDADMLFIDQSKPLKEFLKGREVMVARDIAGWSFNSGFMAFKNSVENIKILQDISLMIDDVMDKSSVYSNQGDQFIFNRYFEDNKLVNDQNVCDYLTVNTHYCFADKSTFVAHFMGLGEPARSCMMEDFEKVSLSSGT